MSQNFIALSCYFEKFNWRRQGQEYGDRQQKFDSISAYVSFPHIIMGSNTVLGPQKMWVAIDPPRRGSGDKQYIDKEQIESAIAAHGNGWQHALVWDGLFNVWGQDKGRPKHELKFGFRGFRLSREPVPPVNRAVIQGRVADHNPQAPWLTIEDVYHNPFAQDKSKQWKIRPVPVYVPQLVVPGAVSLNGRQVLVFGALSALAVVAAVPGAALQTQQYLHVMASEIHVCPS